MTFSQRMTPIAFNPKFAITLLISVWVWAFWPTIIATIHTYNTSGSDYHGYLVLPLLLVLIWQRGASLKRAFPNPNYLGLLSLLLFGLVWILASITPTILIQQVTCIAIFLTLFLTTFGKKISSILFLPLICLFFALPVGADIFHVLQKTFYWFLVQSLTLFQSAIYWQENSIFVGDRSYSLAEYLHSMHYATIVIMLGAALNLSYCRGVVKLTFLTFNYILIPFTLLLVGLSSVIALDLILKTNLSNVVSLNILGWAITGLGTLLAMLFTFIARNRKNLLTNRNDIDWHNKQRYNNLGWFIPTILASVILALLPILPKYAQHSAHLFKPALPQNNQIQTTFSPLSSKLGINIPAADYTALKQQKVTVSLYNKPIQVVETILRKGNVYEISWHINYINGHLTTSPLLAQVLQSAYLFTVEGSNIALITFTTRANKDINLGRERLRAYFTDFAQNNIYT